MVTVYKHGDVYVGRFVVPAHEIPYVAKSVAKGMMDQSGRIVRPSRYRKFLVIFGCDPRTLKQVNCSEFADKWSFARVDRRLRVDESELVFYGKQVTLFELGSLSAENVVLVDYDKCYKISSKADVHVIVEIESKSVYDVLYEGVPVIEYDTEEV